MIGLEAATSGSTPWPTRPTPSWPKARELADFVRQARARDGGHRTESLRATANPIELETDSRAGAATLLLSDAGAGLRPRR